MRSSKENLGEPRHGLLCGGISGRRGFELNLGTILNWRPLAGILDIPSEFLETAGLVGTKKDIDAPVVVAIFNTGKNEPRFIDAFGHMLQSGINTCPRFLYSPA
jgi:hypothetical protein